MFKFWSGGQNQPERQMTKEAARKLKGDFIPNGTSVDITTLLFRRTSETEILRCCQPTSHDPQSGPIYCGDVSEYVALTENGYVAFCERHKPHESLLEEPRLRL